jgi:hypothetical protein
LTTQNKTAGAAVVGEVAWVPVVMVRAAGMVLVA